MLVEEGVWRRNGELPTEAEPPHLKIKSLKVLGTPTCDCVELEKNAKLGAEKLGAEKLRSARLRSPSDSAAWRRASTTMCRRR